MQAVAAATFVSATGYHISIINPFILLTFITRSNMVHGDDNDGDGDVSVCGLMVGYMYEWVCMCAMHIRLVCV